MRNIYILDWSWYMFRAYHGLPEMVWPDGVNVNAIFGFFKMIIKLLQTKPDRLIITRDGPKKTFRHEANPDYKWQRPPLADEFVNQIKVIKSLTQQLGLICYQVDGYEADDVIYTLACKLPSDYLTIFTSDKDIKQLLQYDHIKISDPAKNITYSHKDFVQEYWFEPQFMVDYISLIGDSADNLKWVRGIWPKTASNLIQKYHTIDKIYNHLDELPLSISSKLINDKDTLYATRSLVELATIDDIDMSTIWLENKLDIRLYKDIFLNQYRFASYKNLLQELESKYSMVQGSLFG